MQFNYCADYIYAQRCYLEKSRGGSVDRRVSANQQLGVSQSARTAIQFGFHAMPLWKFQLSTADFGVAFARHNYSAARLFVFKKYRHMLFFSSNFIFDNRERTPRVQQLTQLRCSKAARSSCVVRCCLVFSRLFPHTRGVD